MASALSPLFRRKALADLQHDGEVTHLRRTLGTGDLVALGIGAIIGAGIFSTIGTAAAGNLADGRVAAGPALMLSFVLTAVACGFTALCYAEMASMIPVSGSAYTYAYATMGELVAWIVGWDLLLEYAVSNVAVAISWGDYARSFLANVFHLHIPGWLATDPRTALTLVEGAPPMGLGAKLAALAEARAGALDGGALFTSWEVLRTAPTIAGFPVTVNLLAVAITLVITWLVYIGIKESSRANTVMVVVKVAILLLVAGIGVAYVQGGNWVPFSPNGWKGVQAGSAIIFFAFIGFDAVSTTAEECRDPGRDMPRGIIWSLVICTVIYVLVAAVVTGMVHYTELAGKADPLAYVFERYDLGWLAGIIAFGAVIATTAALLVYQVGQPRIFMAMSRDGLLGPWFGKISSKHGTPGNATWLTGAIVAIPAALGNIAEVVELTNIGTLFAFGLVCGSVLILRVARPDAERRFRVRWPWLVAPAGILGCLWIARGLPTVTWVRFVVWMGLGLLLYFVYGRRRSLLRRRAGAASGA